MSRELIDIKQIDVSKLNDVKIYDVLPEEIEGQVAYCTGDGKLYYGDGSEWKEISGGEGLPVGEAEQTIKCTGGSTYVATNDILLHHGDTDLEVRIGRDFNTSRLLMGTTGYHDTITITASTNNEANIQLYANDSANMRCGTFSAGSVIEMCNGYIELYDNNSNEQFQIKPDGTIKSKTLSGTTSSLLESKPDGTIQRSTQTIPAAQIQSDWNQTNNTQVDYIKNKPVIPTGLPIATTNGQTVRYNGTGWVSTTKAWLYEDASTSIIQTNPTSASCCQMLEIGTSRTIAAKTSSGVYSIISTDGTNAYLRMKSPSPAIFIDTDTISDYIIISKNDFRHRKFVGTNNRNLYVNSSGDILASSDVTKYWKEVIVPITAPTSVIAITDVDLGLTGIDLTTKVKAVQSFYKLSGTTIYDNSNIVGEQIQTNMITANIYPALDNGDSFKLYIEYID